MGITASSILVYIYSRQMKSAVSIAPAAATKWHISLCGRAHHIILSGQSFRPPV